MSFLVVENLDDSDQFILGRDFVRIFDVMIDLNNGQLRIRNLDRKYKKRLNNRITLDENKVPFLNRKKLQPGQTVVAIFRMRNLNSLSDNKQVCLVPFLNKEKYEALSLTRFLDKSGHPTPGHPKLPVEEAAEIKILSRKDPVPLDLLLRSKLVQEELSRMNINILSLLDKTVQVIPQIPMLGRLPEREVIRDDHDGQQP